jgi:hypothetical protein
MQPRVQWYIRAYHSFLVYLPVILIFVLIALVYCTYLSTYIAFLLNAELDDNYYPFLFTSSSKTAFTKGVILLSIVTFCLFMLVIALLKTIIMDPGYFPSPLKLENKIIHKNIFKQCSKKNLPGNQNYDPMVEEGENIFQVESIEEKYKFLSNFNNTVSEMPLTFQENIQIRGIITKYVEEPREKNLMYKQQKDERLDVNTSSNSCNEHVSLDSNQEDFFDKFRGVDLSKAVLCGTCLRWKVERSHHCRQCGRCVLKMDHHCPWLANCIGFRNYKFFCLVHLYGIIATSIMALTYWEVLLNVNLNHTSNIGEVFFVSFVYISNLGLFGFLLWLFTVNWRLVLSGQTVIENADRERFPSTKALNIYDLGCYRNFTTVFGKNPLVWFIPFFPNYDGEGLVFETINNRK